MAIEFKWGQSGTVDNVNSVLVSAGGSVISANDLLIACVVPQDPPTDADPNAPVKPPGAVIAPPGWVQLDNTQIGIDSGFSDTAAIFYKIADGSESTNALTFTWSNGANCSWTLADYSGVDTSAPIDAALGKTNTSDYSTDTTAPSVAAQAGDTLVNIWISKGGTDPFTGDPSTTVRVNVNSNDSIRPEIMVADESVLSSGPTGSKAMGEQWSTINQRGFSIALNAAACFMSGTMIRTPGGEVAVETIARGDYITTADGRAVKVSWLGRQTVAVRFADPVRVLPIRIAANALGENVPSRDLLVSPDHAILIEGILIQAGALVNGHSIIREANVPSNFTYYHVELEDHSLIFAENVPAETFVDNVDRLAFDNWAEHEAIYPEGRQISEMPYPRAKAFRQVPKAIRARLAERAEHLGRAELLRIA